MKQPFRIKIRDMLLPKIAPNEMVFRKLIFFNHSSCNGQSLYGDDGEMQCVTCDIDFVRDTAEEIHSRILEINLFEYSMRYKEAQEAKTNTKT